MEISDEDLWKKLWGAVLKLDIGVNDENLDELCELVYLPRWSSLKKSQGPYIGAANEEYITSLEKQIDDVCSSSIYECDVSLTCNAIFFSTSKLKYHRLSRHNTAISAFGQKPGSPDRDDTFSRDPEPQQGNNKRKNEQMTLGIANQL